MNRSLRPRTLAKLSESTLRRLQAYELGAISAGVGMLVLASPGEAKIIYTPAHRILKVGMIYKLDLNHDGVVDFALRDLPCKSCGGGAVLSALPSAGNGVSGFATSFGNWASALKRGALIGTRRYFPGKELAFAATTGDGQTISEGSWVNVMDRYLGLKFKINGRTHYGWARLNVKIQGLSITATLTGYAYETLPNKPIIAGQTKGADESDGGIGKPEAAVGAPTARLATLGMLAMGAPALSIWRRDETVGVA